VRVINSAKQTIVSQKDRYKEGYNQAVKDIEETLKQLKK
jgi:hypothetical protein